MLKLKSSELLDLKGLRKICRLRSYDVLKVYNRKVLLTCVHHGEWEDQQLRVLADSAECPACGKTRPKGVWSFSSDEWKKVLRNVQPHIRYIDKASVIEGRTLYKHKCKNCDAKFRNSFSALLHPMFKCPNCKYELSGNEQANATKYRKNLKIQRKRETKIRDDDFYMRDMKAAYDTLKNLGVVEYPPSIELKVEQPKRKEKSKPCQEELDIEDTVVKNLEVRVDDEVLHLIGAEELPLVDESHELELSDTFTPSEYGTTSGRSAVAVYAGRNGTAPTDAHGNMSKAAIDAYYGVRST